MRLPLWACLVFCCLLAGCGISDFEAVTQNYKADSSYTSYHSYGDSITAGFGLDPSTEAYPALIGRFNKLPLVNYALSGDQACDVPTRQIFPARDHPSLSQKSLYTLLVSTNDANVKGAGPYESVFTLCHQASLAWIATPEEWKIEAASDAVHSSGPVHIETTNSWNALVTDGLGASVDIPFSRPDTGAVYLWYRIMDGNPGTFTYAVDGAVMGSLVTGTSPAIASQSGRGDSLALLRLPSVAGGSHLLRLTQTTSGNYGMGIVAIGMPQVVRSGTLPRVLVGTTPRQLKGGAGPCSNNTAACDAYTADIVANGNLLKSDGLQVVLFDSKTYEQGSSADLLDAIHPNALGNVELFRAVEDVLSIIP